MRAIAKCLVSCCVLAALGTATYGTEFTLKPVGATGSHTFNGDEIILQGGGQAVTLEIRVDDWRGSDETGLGKCWNWDVCDLSNPDCADGSFCRSNDGLAKGWQATIDASTYEGILGPSLPACTADAACQVYGNPAATCNIGEGVCEPTACAFIDSSNPEYIFHGLSEFAAVSTNQDNYGYLSATLAAGIVYDDVDMYCGTLVLDVPAVGAAGSFSVGFVEDWLYTHAADVTGIGIAPFAATPAIITVVCQDHDDCSDTNECDTDYCSDGVCTHLPKPEGTGCDDDQYCTVTDTCVGGVCQGTGNPCSSGEWCTEGGDACIPYGDGDFYSDGRLDLVDFAEFQNCFGEYGLGECQPANMTGGGVVDLDDFDLFAAAFAGPR